ncbi:hypothetical protein HDV01_006216 [Terramyces sp. JEL0728]|nr:hypothetical protein HDV01_006216 [Terramyces sp. JEL0728]
MRLTISALFTLAAAHIQLESPISRNLTTAATEDQVAQLVGPCGGKAVPGPRTLQPLQFSITIENSDSNSELWINAAAGNDPTVFPSSLFTANFTNPGPATIAIDLTQIPGLNGLTPVTLQIVQSAADAPQDKFICADLMVSAPVVSTTTTTTTTTTTSTTATIQMAQTIPAYPDMAQTITVAPATTSASDTYATPGAVYNTPGAVYNTPGAVYQTPVAVYTTGPIIPSYPSTSAPVVNMANGLKPLLILIPFIL